MTNASIYPGTNGTVGTLTLGGNVSLTGSQLCYDIGSTSDLIVMGSGSLSLGGTVVVNYTGGAVAADSTWPLITYTSGVAPSLANLSVSGSTGNPYFNFGLAASTSQLSLTAVRNLSYAGTFSWTGTTGNWSNSTIWNVGSGLVPTTPDTAIIAPVNNNSKTVTVDSNITVTNLTIGGDNVGTIDYYGTIPLTIAGTSTLTVTGSFNYTAFGITPFAPVLSGVAPTVSHGELYLQNAGDNFTGTIDVAGGMLYAASSGALGGATSITLGSAGQLGGIGTNAGGDYGTPVTLTQNITLAGNGGIIGGHSLGFLEETGTVSGSGMLVVVDGSGAGGMSYVGDNWYDKLDGNNTSFTGGMVVANGALSPGGANRLANDVFGTGNIRITDNGLLEIDSAANLGVGAVITVSNTQAGGGLAVGMNDDYMPAIAPASSGTILVGPYTGANIDSVLGSSTVPVGNGNMWLGAAYNVVHTYGDGNNWGYSVYTGTSLEALILDDPTHTYKIGGGDGADLELGNPGWSNYGTSRSPGVLHDVGSTVCNVVFGKPGPESLIPGNYGNSNGTYVRVLDANNYSGTTTINVNTTVVEMDFSNGSGLGGTGNILINGPGMATDSSDGEYGVGLLSSMTVRGLNDNGYMINKGNLTFNGSVCITFEEGASGSWNNPNGTSIAQMTVTSLTRSGRSTLTRSTATPPTSAPATSCSSTATPPTWP